MRKISRRFYKGIINNTEDLKAVAFLLYIKHHAKCSVVSNYSYNKLSKFTGLHKQTVKKRLETLGELDLISIEGKQNNHLRFKKVRAKYNSQNVNISALDYSSVKSIALGLQALFIVEIQRKKDFIKQLFDSRNNPKNTKQHIVSKKKIKNNKSIRSNNFNDNGISYNYISKNLKVNSNKVSAIIKHGIKMNFFSKQVHIEKIGSFGNNVINSIQQLGLKHYFCSKGYTYTVSCNTYTIVSPILKFN